MDSLPDDVFTVLFPYLDPIDVVVSLCVCRRFRSLLHSSHRSFASTLLRSLPLLVETKFVVVCAQKGYYSLFCWAVDMIATLLIGSPQLLLSSNCRLLSPLLVFYKKS